MTRFLFLASSERSDDLAAELQPVCPLSDQRVVDGDWISCPLQGEVLTKPLRLAFAQQCLPNIEEISAGSISQWAHAVVERMLPPLREHPSGWRLHVYRSRETLEGAGQRRVQLVEEAILKELKERRRKLWRNHIPNSPQAWSEGEALVQVVLRTAIEGWFSLCQSDERMRLRHCLSRFPAGRVEVPEDASAPSGAHAKLREVLLRSGREFSKGDTVVELGASPGGWTHVAAHRGAQVVAIDRSPLREDLMQHPQVTFVKANAFEYTPPTKVDWLLSDIVAFPRDILGLLERWLLNDWCASFCVTIKFKGAEDYPILAEFNALLDKTGVEAVLRRLDHNRNEVTVYGSRGQDPAMC